MRLQGEHQTIGFFEFVDVQCEDDCPFKCYKDEMAGIFHIDAFGKMELRLQYTGHGPCLDLLGAKQATGRVGGFRMHGYLNEPLSTRKPSIGVDNYVTFDDCVITNLPFIGSAEITISVGYAIEREQIDGDITFSKVTVGIDGLLQWLRVNSIDAQRDRPGQGHWKIEPKSADRISYQFEDVRIEFVPTISPPGWYAAIPEKYTVRQGMLIRFIYSEEVPLKTLMESMREFQDFLAFALHRPVMVRSAVGFYPEDDSTSAFNLARPIYFPSRQQPDIDITGIYKGDYNSLFVYDQIDDFASTFAAWRKLRSEVGDHFFGSIVDMYLECLYGSRLANYMLVDYMKIIELMQRQFKGMDESALKQWNWDIGPFPQEKDLMVEPYWDKFFLSSLKEIGYASTPKKFGKTARILRDAIVHPVGAAARLKTIGIKEGDKRTLRDYVIKYAMMYERLVQLYLVTFIGLDPIKLGDDRNLFASRVLGPSLTIGDIRVN